MQRTFSRIKEAETCTVPMWVTLAMSPLGNLIEIWTEEVMVLKKEMEWTMWSMAPLSRIQSVGLRWEISIVEENTEYSKEGKDQMLESSWPWSPMEDCAMMLATWGVFTAVLGGAWVPKWHWEFNNPINYWYSALVKDTPSFEPWSTAMALLAKVVELALFLNL